MTNRTPTREGDDRSFPAGGPATVFLALLSAVAISAVEAPHAAAQDPGQPPSPSSIDPAEVDLDRMVPVDVATVGMDLHVGNPIALLHDDEWDDVLPIFIGEAEAQAIAMVLQGFEPPRPMTHDLLASVVGELDGTLEEVIVHSLMDGTYHGMLRVRVNGEVRNVDSRPSDALALALRTGASIRVNPDFFEDPQDVDFLAATGEENIVRTRGVTVGRATDELGEEFGLPEDREGVVVLSATEEVEARGLRRGDLIVDVNGGVPAGPEEFLESVVRDSPDDGAQVVYYRDGHEELITLPERDGPPTPADQTE